MKRSRTSLSWPYQPPSFPQDRVNQAWGHHFHLSITIMLSLMAILMIIWMKRKLSPPRCWWLQKAALWSWCYRAELNEGKLECCSDRKENETGQKKYPNASLPVDRGRSSLTATSYSCHKPRGGWMLLDSNTQIHRYKYNTKPHISATNPGEADCCQSQHDQ